MPELTNLLTPALVVALFAWLRSDIRKLYDRLDTTAKDLNGRLDTTAKDLNARMDAMAKGFNERIDASNRDIHERIDASNRDIHERMDKRFDAVLHELAELRERMAKMEGSLEGFLAGRRDRDAA